MLLGWLRQPEDRHRTGEEAGRGSGQTVSPGTVMRTPVAKLLEAFVTLNVMANYLPEDLSVPRDGRAESKCNFWAADVCKLLGVLLPRMLARRQILWLRSVAGRAAGWYPCTERRAAELAELGYVVIAGWLNPDSERSSHVAVGRPAPKGALPGHLWIIQAGTSCFESGTLAKGFGARRIELKAVEFFACGQPATVEPVALAEEPTTVSDPIPIKLPPQLLPMVLPPRDDDIAPPRPSSPTAPRLTAPMLELVKESGLPPPGAGGWTPKGWQNQVILRGQAARRPCSSCSAPAM